MTPSDRVRRMAEALAFVRDWGVRPDRCPGCGWHKDTCRERVDVRPEDGNWTIYGCPVARARAALDPTLADDVARVEAERDNARSQTAYLKEACDDALRRSEQDADLRVSCVHDDLGWTVKLDGFVIVDRLYGEDRAARVARELAGALGHTNHAAIQRKIAPPLGTAVKCLVCALDKPWGIWSETTGEAVCVVCRDAVHRATEAERQRDAAEALLEEIREAEPWDHCVGPDCGTPAEIGIPNCIYCRANAHLAARKERG